MTAPSVLERCRMALAEIGLSPQLARQVGGTLQVSRSVGVEQGWLLSVCAAYIVGHIDESRSGLRDRAVAKGWAIEPACDLCPRCAMQHDLEPV